MSNPRRDTIDNTVRICGREKSVRVDLGLALLMVVRKPHRRLTTTDIAAWCGCTNTAIDNIQHRALKKLRNHLLFGRGRAAGRELVA